MKLEPGDNISLQEVIPNDAQVEHLYEHLKTRLYNISHEQLPSFDQHKEFVQHHPYRKWFILEKSELIIGNLYVQHDNSVGINCTQPITASHLNAILCTLRKVLEPLSAIPSLRYNDFFINVPIDNKKFQSQLTEIGYKPSQISFVLNK